MNHFTIYIFAAIGMALYDITASDADFYLAATKQYFFAFGYWFCVLCNYLELTNNRGRVA